jgi:hypothetical protein
MERSKSMIPVIPKIAPFAVKAVEPEPPDLRVRTDPSEVLKGLADGKLYYHSLGDGIAIGRGNLQYGLDTLLSLEGQGLVEVHYLDKVRKYQDVVNEIAGVLAEGSNVDEDGIEGNGPSNVVSWHLVV